jgi:transcriptional regulator with XRE-family HTH domain
MTENQLTALGRRIRERREEKKISRRRLADEMGVAKGTVDKWEIGWSHPSRDNMRALSVALDVPEIILREGPPPEADETNIPEEDTSNDDGDLIALLVKIASRLREEQKREVVAGIELTLG